MNDKSNTETRTRTVQGLIRTASTVTLATRMAADGSPYASLVLMATDPRGRPLLLLSDMAVHGQNIAKDPAVSLLIASDPKGRDPLTLSRVSLQGTAEVIADERLLERFIRRFPPAKLYAKFKDFRLYRVNVSAGHLVAGFGDIHWLDQADFILPEGALDNPEVENGVMDHMNSDHADAVQELAASVSDHAGEWEICGVDEAGIDLRCGWLYERLLFEQPATGAGDMRIQIIEMLKKIRKLTDFSVHMR